jgi:hypothetical protein
MFDEAVALTATRHLGSTLSRIKRIRSWQRHQYGARSPTVSSSSSLILDEGVGQPDFDERLPRDAESPGLLIDLPQEVDREIYVHALDSASGTDRLGEVQMR